MIKSVYKIDSGKRDDSVDNPVEPDGNDWEDADESDAKDCWVATGELAAFLGAQEAFKGAGYSLQHAELLEAHPMWVFFLKRTTAPRILEADKFLHHVRDLLWSVHVYFFDDDLIIQPTSSRIIISILWRIPNRGNRRQEAWEQRRFQELLDQLP